MVWMWMTSLAFAVDGPVTCPTEVLEAKTDLQDAVEARHEARETLLDTDWAYRMATEDRDAVRAEQAETREALSEARGELRSSRRTWREIKRTYPKEERSCEPSAALESPADDTRTS